MKKIFKKQILQDVKMDTCTNFMANGDINIYPCPWEDDKVVTDNKGRVRYRGGIEVDADGRTRVKRYNVGANGPKLDTLFETTHGGVKMTRPQIKPDGFRRVSQEFVYVTFKFPKKYPLWMIRENFEREHAEVMAFLETRKEATTWK